MTFNNKATQSAIDLTANFYMLPKKSASDRLCAKLINS